MYPGRETRIGGGGDTEHNILDFVVVSENFGGDGYLHFHLT